MSEELKKLTPIKALRLLTGMFPEDQAIQVLAFCNLIGRYLDKDDNLEKDFLLSQFEKIGINLVLEN
jgi:hypothetical protein